jgi:hypothetical protein
MYLKGLLPDILSKVRSGSEIRIRYICLGSHRIRPDQKVIKVPTGSTTLFEKHFKGLCNDSDGLYPASAFTRTISLFKLLEPVLWIHKNLFRIRIRRSVIVPHGSGSRRPINYGNGRIRIPTRPFLAIEKKYVVKYVVNH